MVWYFAYQALPFALVLHICFHYPSSSDAGRGRDLGAALLEWHSVSPTQIPKDVGLMMYLLTLFNLLECDASRASRTWPNDALAA